MHDYDKIIKENIHLFSLGLVKTLLKLNIEEVQPLTLELQKTIERRPDFLAKVSIDGMTDILHIEFQTEDDPNMFVRMHMYKGLIWSKFGIQYKVHQYVFYIGNAHPTRMKRTPPNHSRTFAVYSLKTYPYALFLEAETPEAVVMGILTNFGKEENESVIEKILQRILVLCKGNIGRFDKCAQQLEILAQKRNLQYTVTKIRKTMPLVFDIHKDPRFQEGEQEGETGILSKVLQYGIDKVLVDYIQSNLDKQRSLSAIAKRLNIPVERLINLIKENKGK